MSRAAVYLDRDGTIIEHVHYLDDPADVQLCTGCADAIRLFRDLGLACIVVTNQSAIERGRLTVERLEAIHDEMNRQLAAEGVGVDAIYFCPRAPGTEGDRTTVEHPDRKPGPGMLLRAAEEHDLDVTRSFMVGDMMSDVLAGHNAGCRASILIGDEADESIRAHRSQIDYLASGILDAAHWIGTQVTRDAPAST